MAEQPEVLREQIRETHEALASKVSTLEDKVVGTVNNTTEAVAETVENVKATVSETVEAVKETVTETIQTVKRTFDIEYQVREHPWPMMAGAVGAGFLAGRLLPRVTCSVEKSFSNLRSDQPARSAYTSAAAAAPTHNGHGNVPSGQESWLGGLAHQFRDELEQVKCIALGTLFGLVRDWAIQNLPEKLAPHVQEVIDNVTTKLGGTKIEGPVMENR
jgi:ElaB/YqjD/DUF883 family membrane-anchored ribosome-binding protein